MSLTTQVWPQGYLVESEHSFLCNCFYGDIIRLLRTLGENGRFSPKWEMIPMSTQRKWAHTEVNGWKFIQSLARSIKKGPITELLLLTPFSFQHQSTLPGRKIVQKYPTRLGTIAYMADNQFGLHWHSVQLFSGGIWTTGSVIFWLTHCLAPDVKYSEYHPNLSANLVSTRWCC